MTANENSSSAHGDRRPEVEGILAELQSLLDDYKPWAHRRLFARLDGEMIRTALSHVEMACELSKPESERDERYRGSALDSSRAALLAPKKSVDKEFEVARLKSNLEMAIHNLGRNDAFVMAALGGKPAVRVANELAKTRIDDAEFRRSLVEGDPAKTLESNDPILRLARDVADIRRDLLDRRASFEADRARLYERLGELRRIVMGRHGAPDANFTLRLSFGEVKGYELGTTDVPYTTSVWGLYERHNTMRGQFPYDLPPAWAKAKRKIDLDTEFNFVCTADIIGGNSGSPVFNRKAEVVGLIFDGNIQSLGNKFVFDDRVARSVSVHSNILVESLRSVYGAHTLADELVGSRLLK